MKHLILGSGNLGSDLNLSLPACSLLSQSKPGFRAADLLKSQDAIRGFDAIWYCIGAGSIPEAKADPEGCRAIYETIPLKLIETAEPGQALIFFSSDYCADEDDPSDPRKASPGPRSAYARIRIDAERRILDSGRTMTTVVRVGSLYGRHKPGRTFPGKLLANPSPVISLPSNLVTPTPTAWLAEVMAGSLGRILDPSGPSIHHCSPYGAVAVRDWGRLILGTDRISNEDRIDQERPLISALGCSFRWTNRHDSWLGLWSRYGSPWFQSPTTHSSSSVQAYCQNRAV